MINNLNENDNQLLLFCINEKKTITEIAKHLQIAPKNVSVRLEKLKEKNLIDINKGGIGKKTFIRTKKGDEIKKYLETLILKYSLIINKLKENINKIKNG